MAPALRRVLPVAVVAIAVASWFSAWAAWAAGGIAIVAHMLVTATFAQSLRPGREPLIATFCRLARGDVPPECVTYIWRLTVIWVAVMALLTLDLIVTAIAAPEWMRRVTMANFVVIIGLYAGEHLVRSMVFPHLPRYSLLKTGRVVMQAMRDRR